VPVDERGAALEVVQCGTVGHGILPVTGGGPGGSALAEALPSPSVPARHPGA
jgi:hypothetical protein